jgi:uncharacterized protein involved in exopolysaccharide biosynthesis
VESQVRVLTSDNVLRRVIGSERLDKDREPTASPKPKAAHLVDVDLAPPRGPEARSG